MTGDQAPTYKQLDFVKKLLNQYNWQSERDAGKLEATAVLSTLLNVRLDIANGETGEKWSQNVADKFAENLPGKKLTRRTISSLIDYLRSLPKAGQVASDEALAAAGRPKGTLGIPWDNVKRQIREAGRKTPDGFYQIDESHIYKVVLSQNDRLYAKRLVVHEPAVWGEDGTLVKPAVVEWIFEEGAMGKIRPEHKMTEDQATAYGRLYGRCYECGRRLRNELSIYLGIGPICGEREFGGQFKFKIADAKAAINAR